MYKSMDREFLNSLVLLNQESNGALLGAMLRTYSSVWPDYIQRLRHSYHEQDAQSLGEHAASFRTLVGSFGATKLMTILTQLETAAAIKNWDLANKHMQDMKLELCQFQEDIETLRHIYFFKTA